jgi:hypothetical protein
VDHDQLVKLASDAFGTVPDEEVDTSVSALITAVGGGASHRSTGELVHSGTTKHIRIGSNGASSQCSLSPQHHSGLFHGSTLVVHTLASAECPAAILMHLPAVSHIGPEAAAVSGGCTCLYTRRLEVVAHRTT